MAQINNDIEEILISNEEIVKKCEELGKRISDDYEGKTPVIIGLLKGAVPFMSELIKHITCPIQIDFLKASSYEGTETTGKVKFQNDVITDLKDRDIIFVEDIIDTGITLNAVMEEYKKRGAKSMEICTMMDKPEGRKIHTVQPKYIGFEVPKKFVVGFGLDYNELYRNLPYVGVLSEKVYKK